MSVKIILKVIAIRSYNLSKTFYDLIIIGDSESRFLSITPEDVVKISLSIKNRIVHTEEYGSYPSMSGFTEILWTTYETADEAYNDLLNIIQQNIGFSICKIKNLIKSYPYKINERYEQLI